MLSGCVVTVTGRASALPRQRVTPTSLFRARGLCRKCYSELPDVKAAAVKARRLRKYNLTEDEYQGILQAQGWACAICGGDAEAVDHDHTTGRVRGILCRKCNTGLGHFVDSEANLKSAITYLRRVTA